MAYERILDSAEQALLALDADKLVSVYAEDFLFEDLSSGDRITDKDALRAYYDRLFSLPGVSFKDVSFFSHGSRGAGEWTWCGNSAKSATPFAIRGASLFKLTEGGIVQESIFYDPTEARG